MYEYCLIPDVAQLRGKLTSATGDLQHYWRWMQQCARHAPADYPWYQSFCAVVTGEACYAEQARQVLLDFTARLPERDATIFVQYHHWAAAAPMARYGLYYDWVADLAPFTDSERERISDALLDYGVKHVLPSLQTKHQSDENNQVLSLALSATMIGWVYGRRRGPSAAGDALLQYGLQRLMVLMDQLPVGGYSGEGSAYMGQIFAPALIFAAELLREITGEVWLTRPARATGVSVLDVVRMTARNVTPGGLWLPWDHHGFYVAQNYLSLAVLARETGEADWLAVPRATHTWGYEQNMLWGYDDKVWTLLWWPDDLAVPDAPAWRPWLRPEVAGAVVSRDAAVQMVQAWDICGDTGLSSSRMHVNPNTLLCEAFGAPLTMDGSPTSDCTAIKIPGCSQTVHYFGPPATTDWSSGMVGAHSCVLVDGEAGYLTGTCVHGEGLCLAELPGFQAVSADATAFYTPRYDAEQVIRTTMLLDDRLLLVTDAARFASPHALTWRAYLRPEAKVEERCVQQRTAEGVLAEWQFPAADGVTVTEIPGFPNTLEQRSARVDVAYASAQEHQLVSLIYPQQGLAEVAALDGAWHFRADAANVGVRDGWRQPGDAWDTAPSLDISLPWPAFGGDAASRFGWYARAVTITVDATPTRLRLHRFFGQEYRVWWDGQELPIEGVPLVAPYVTLPDAAPGTHWLVLRACHQGMTFTQDDRITTGYARRDTFSGIPVLQAPGDVQPTPALTALDAHWLRVAGSLVLHDNHAAAHQSCDDWRTDARHARLTAEDAWALVDATFLQHGETLCCTADVPVTLGWQSDTLTLGAVPPGGSCTVYVPGAIVRCARAGGLQVQSTGTRGLRLACTGDLRGLPVTVNGQPVVMMEEGCLLEPLAPPMLPTAFTRDALLALADDTTPAGLELLCTALRQATWPLQCAAAWALQRRGDAAAVPELLAALARESTEMVAPDPAEVDADWPGFYVGMGEPLPLPGGDAPTAERAGKRWRLKVAIIEALGVVRDRRSAAPLAEILDALQDPYPVLAAAARALGRIGDPATLPAIARACVYYEACTHLAARSAYLVISGERWSAPAARVVKN